MFLYDKLEIGDTELTRNLQKMTKYTGDDRFANLRKFKTKRFPYRRKLGELAFVLRDQLAFQLRSREELSNVVPLESTEVFRFRILSLHKYV